MKTLMNVLITIALALSVAFLPNESHAETKNFVDLPTNHWGNDTVSFLADKNLINGYEDGTFQPNKPITRAEVAKVVAVELGAPLTNDTSFFEDAEGHWAEKYITAIAKKGTLTGYEDGTFQPNKAITRAEMASILVRAYGLNGTSTSTFCDTTSSWAADFISILDANNIVAGYGDGSFRPNKPITRAEFSAFLARVLDDSFKIEKEAPQEEASEEPVTVPDNVTTPEPEPVVTPEPTPPATEEPITETSEWNLSLRVMVEKNWDFVEGAKVELFDKQGNLVHSYILTEQGADGYFYVGKIQSGTYDVTASVPELNYTETQEMQFDYIKNNLGSYSSQTFVIFQ